MIDDFYFDPRLFGGVSRAPRRPDYVGKDSAVNAATVESQLRSGHPVVLHGEGGPLGHHFVLAVGLTYRGDGSARIVALDPLPNGNAGGPGQRIEIDPAVMTHPSLAVVFKSMRLVAPPPARTPGECKRLHDVGQLEDAVNVCRVIAATGSGPKRDAAAQILFEAKAKLQWVARDDVDDVPRLPVVYFDRGVCPGEGCWYGEWKAIKPTKIYENTESAT